MAQRQRQGFSLLEIAIALTIVGLLTAGAAQMLTTLTVRSQEQTTKQNMERVKQALIDYFARTCSLPCPAPADVPRSSSDAGEAQHSGTSCSLSGAPPAVPWQAIGISPDASIDGWGRRIRYQPAGKLEKEPSEDPPLKGLKDVPSEAPCEGDPEGDDDKFTEWLNNKEVGLKVAYRGGSVFQDPTEGTGAAFVLVSHGPNGLGGYGRSGSGIGSSDIDEDEEENTDATEFVDGRRTGPGADEVFDDIVISIRVERLKGEAGIHSVTPSDPSGDDEDEKD